MSVKLIAPQVRVVVRLHDIRNANKAKRAGADEIVSPDFTGGMRIASAMLRPHVVSFMDRMLQSDAGLRMEEVRVPEGRSPGPLAAVLPRARSYLVVAVHDTGAWEFNPSDEHTLHPGMTVVIMATPDGRSEVERRLAQA